MACRAVLGALAVAIAMVAAAFRSWVLTPLLLEPVDMTGRVVVLTGGTDGIGREAAEFLVLMNSTVVLGARNMEKGASVKKELERICTLQVSPPCLGKIDLISLDLASFQSVRDFSKAVSQRYSAIHILMNNAGLMRDSTGKGWLISEDGVEICYQVNHLSHFLLTESLLENLSRGANETAQTSRIIHVSSFVHTGGELNRAAYGPTAKNALNETARLDYQTYADTKLMQVVYSKQLAKRLSGSGVISIAVHPGAVVSQLDEGKADGKRETAKRFKKYFGRSTSDGAKTQVIVSTRIDFGLEQESGRYISDRCVMARCIGCFLCDEDGERTHPAAKDLTEQKWLYETSRAITGL